MDTNSQNTPPANNTPTFPRIPDEPQPISPVVNKNRTKFIKIFVGFIAVVLIATGTSYYLWQNDQSNIKKNEEIAQAKLDEAAAEKKKAAESKINNTIPISDFVGSSTAVKARSAQAQSNANVAQRTAELLFAESGYYPRTTADFISGSSSQKLPSDIIPSILNPTADNGLTTFRWEYIGPPTSPTGGRITYWDFTTNAISTNVVYVGAAEPDSIFITPAS